jgi:hypothetical protein
MHARAWAWDDLSIVPLTTASPGLRPGRAACAPRLSEMRFCRRMRLFFEWS